MTLFLAACNMRCDGGFTAQMQACDMRHDFLGRAMMLGQIVNEDCPAGLPFLKDRCQRRAFGPLIGIDRDIDTEFAQLFRAFATPFIEQIGQNHDIGLFADGADRLPRP